MSIFLEPKTCVCDYVEDGCQNKDDTWNWGWNTEQFFANRPGDAIQSVAWVVPAELTNVTEFVGGAVFYVQIANNTGVVGETYPIYATMTTSNGEVVTLRINITLTDIAS